MPEFSQTLVAPDGREVVATSPAQVNDLVYGSGYRVKPEPKPEAAAPTRRATRKSDEPRKSTEE